MTELSDPATLRAWLFALVRAECHHHPLPSLGDTDEPIARPEQPDATLRIMAWNSVMSLDLVQRQALDLATRHGMTEAEISLILGLPLPGTTELLATTRSDLERATTSPAAGGADAVASGKQAGTRGGTRAGGRRAQTTRRTVTVAVVPRTQPGQAGAAAGPQATARLTVSPASLVLDQRSTGYLTLTASGGSVPWSAGATGSVGVSPASGQLGNGDSATVTVTVQRSGDDGGSATVSINGAQVSVSWSARPASPAPSGSSASGASGSAGSAGASPPAGRRHHRPNAGGSPAPAGS